MPRSISHRPRLTRSTSGNYLAQEKLSQHLHHSEMQAQGELLRKEMGVQESRQRAAIDDLMEAIDVRAQVAELGEDVRCTEGTKYYDSQQQQNRGLQDPPVCYVCAFQQLWSEVGFSDVKVVNKISSFQPSSTVSYSYLTYNLTNWAGGYLDLDTGVFTAETPVSQRRKSL